MGHPPSPQEPMPLRLPLVSWAAPSDGGALSHTKPVRNGCVSLGVAGPVSREVSRVARLASMFRP